MFYVLEGTLTMRLGVETTDLPTGSFVSNPGEAPVRFLNFNWSAGWE